MLVDKEFAIRDVTSGRATVFDSDEDRPYLEGTVELYKKKLMNELLIHEFFFVESKRRRMKSKGPP